MDLMIAVRCLGVEGRTGCPSPDGRRSEVRNVVSLETEGPIPMHDGSQSLQLAFR